MNRQELVQDRRLMGGAAAIALFAALGGFTLARCTGDMPTASETEEKAQPEAPKAPDTLAMSDAAIARVGIATEAI